MENWFNTIRQNTNLKIIYITSTVFVVFLSLAGIVALSSDLGLSAEVTAYRKQIWLTILIMAILLVLTYELIKEHKLASTLRDQAETLNKQLDEAKQREESLLRLMESYKRAAYTEVLDHLNRLLLLIVKRQQWQEKGAKVLKIKIKQYSGAENIDPDFAVRERIEVIINIGTQSNVCEGMEFLVRDPSVPIEYGLISVRKAHSDGSICILNEELDASFWSQIMQAAEQGKPSIFDAPDNCIVPNLPHVLDSVTPELAQNILNIMSTVSLNQTSE